MKIFLYLISFIPLLSHAITISSVGGGYNDPVDFSDFKDQVTPPSIVTNNNGDIETTEGVYNPDLDAWVDPNGNINHIPDNDDPYVWTPTGTLTNPTNDLDTIFEDPENPVTPKTGQVDTDDDVPMLTSIYERLEELKDINKQYINNVEKKVTGIQGRLLDENGSYTEQNATLADIVNAIRGDQADINATDTQEESDSKEALISGIDNFATDIIDAIPTDPNSYLDTMFEMDAGEFSFYLDPIAGTVSGIDFPFSWQDIADWISLFLVFVSLILYWQASLQNLDEILSIVTVAPKTAPASSILQIKVKVILIASLVASVIFGGLIGILESNFTILGTTGTIFDLIANTGSLLIAGGTSTWSSMAISLLFDLVPVITILYLVGGFYIQKLGAKIALFVGFSFVQKAS
jgi:hypothetical protein